MAFLDLEEGILAEFAEHAGRAHANVWWYLQRRQEKAIERGRDYYQRVRTRPDVRARENAAVRDKRQSERAERAGERKCVRCGRPVLRLGARGKVPTHCTKKCMRAGVWERWAARNSAARNERRRAA